MEEIWKKINYGNNNYSVSNLGRVRNDNTKKLLSQSVGTTGYYIVKLWFNNTEKNFKTHRLIAKAFIENPENKCLVDHIDNNPLNNSISNLRWSTNQENCFNQKIRSTNTSSVKGVWYDKSRNKWVAEIMVNCRKIYLGRYKTLEEAKHVRINKANELFGEFKNVCEN